MRRSFGQVEGNSRVGSLIEGPGTPHSDSFAVSNGNYVQVRSYKVKYLLLNLHENTTLRKQLFRKNKKTVNESVHCLLLLIF